MAKTNQKVNNQKIHQGSNYHGPLGFPVFKISESLEFLPVEFDDSLTTSFGWENPRHSGCKTEALYYNQFTTASENGRLRAGPQRSTTPTVNSLGVPRTNYEGDDSYGGLPVIENSSTVIFYGTNVIGYLEDNLYETPGPDFSYLKIDRAYVFNVNNGTHYVVEANVFPQTEFSRIFTQNFKWSDNFEIKVLDKSTQTNLKPSYGVHYNRGLFSLCGTYTTSSGRLGLGGSPDGGAEHQFDETLVFTKRIQWNHSRLYPQKYYGYRPVNLTQETQNIFQWGHDQNQNAQYFRGSTSQSMPLSGTFRVNNENPSMNWWFEPRSISGAGNWWGINPLMLGYDASKVAVGDNILDWASGSNQYSTSSIHKFIKEITVRGQENDELYIVTANEAQHAHKEFEAEFTATRKNTLQVIRSFGSLPLTEQKTLGLPNTMTGSKTGITFFNTNNTECSFTSNQGISWKFDRDNIDFTFGYPATHQISMSKYFNNEPPGTTFEQDESDNPIAKWTISKLETRNNVILTDLKKSEELPNDIGEKGFVLLPSNIHSKIKNNLDYYLKRSQLIDKGSTRIDRTRRRKM